MKDQTDDSFFSKAKSALIKAGVRVVYSAFLLRVVLKRKETPLVDKVITTLALLYFVMPWDGLPDIFPGFGYTDDLTVLLGAMKIVSNNITPDVEEEAKDDFENVFGFSPDV